MRKIYGNIEINTDYEYYKYLGVDENATTEEIKNGFENRKAELASASINMTGEEVATSYLLLEQAVKILTDDELRKAYDDLVKEANYKVNKEEVEQLIIDAEKQLEYNKKDELIVQLEEEKEKLRKINEANEEYIKELERKLSISSNSNNDTSDKEDKDINKDLNDSDKNNEEQPTVKNDDNNNKNEDIKPIFNDTEEPQRDDETEEIDKNNKIALKAARGSSKVFVSVAVVAAVAIVILTYSTNSTKRAEDKKAEAGLERDLLTTSMIGTTNGDYDVEEEEVQVVEEEPYEVQLDINSDTVILETVNKIENEISKLNDPVVKDMLNHETIEALVRYTRDNTVLSGETAYELFQVLYNNGIDTSMFFENLESYETMNKLYESTKAIDANNNTYDDEIVAYLSIDNAVDSLKADDYAAIWNVSAISDEATGISSMVMISDKEVKLEVPEKLRDVNNDGKITAEENVEGEEYWNEKNSISSDNKVKCGAIYDKVRSDQESKLRNLRWNALDNENVRTLG